MFDLLSRSFFLFKMERTRVILNSYPFRALFFCHHSHVDTNNEMQSLSPGQANTLYPRPACFQLFHCDRFGQVAGLIGISALGQCRMIGEQLRGDGVDDGGQKIGGCGHRDLCPGALGRCL